MLSLCGEIAQPVEQRPEKPCVPSSILGLATIFVSSQILHFFEFITWSICIPLKSIIISSRV